MKRDEAIVNESDKLSNEMSKIIDKFVRKSSLEDKCDRWAVVEHSLARQMACILSSTSASQELKMLIMANWVQLVLDLTRLIEKDIAAHKKAKAEGRMN